MKKSLQLQLLFVIIFAMGVTVTFAQLKTNGANLDLGNANIVNGGTGNFSNGISITGGSLNLNARSITNVQDLGMNGLGQFIIGASTGDKIVMNGGNITTCGNLSFNSNKTLDMNSGNMNSVGTITATNVNPTNLGGHALTGNVNANSNAFSNVQDVHMTGGGQITHPGGTSGIKIVLNGGDIDMGGGNILNQSDGRLKTEIASIPNVLDKIGQIRGVYYHWNREKFPENNYSENQQIGFIAQELQSVFPELVQESPNGYLSVTYNQMTAVLTQAVKEQQTIIVAQQQELDAVKAQLEKVEALNAAYKTLTSRLDKMESMMKTTPSSDEIEIGEE